MAQARTRTSSPRRAAPSNTSSRPARRSGGVKPQAAASAPRRSSEPGRVPRKRPQAARKADRASAGVRSSKADGGRPGRASASKRSARVSGSSSARASGSGVNGRHGSHIAGAVPEAAEAAAQAAKRRVGAAVNGAGKLGNVKAPLIASGAALAGVAGGWALSGARDRVPGMKGNGGRRIHLDSKDISHTAKQIGAFTEQLGSLAAEIRRTRETAAGAETRRSPIEVVLQGLTARR
jgi:hypothetical protein